MFGRLLVQHRQFTIKSSVGEVQLSDFGSAGRRVGKRKMDVNGHRNLEDLKLIEGIKSKKILFV